MGKLSKYNIYLQKDDALHIVNTLSGAMLILPNHNKEALVSYIDKPGALSDALHNNGVIVDDNVNEKEIANVRYYEYVNQNDLHIVIMPTFDCNFKCRYCFETKNRLKIDEDTLEGIKNFVRVRCKKIKNLYVTWFGGEPLLVVDKVISLMEYFHKLSRIYGFYLKQNMITNGYYLSAQLAKRLCSYGCNNYQITLDGLQETHDYLRPLSDGTGSYDQLIKNLREIRDSTENKRIRILLRVNMTKRLSSELMKFVDFLTAEFLYDKRFSVMWRRASDWDGEITEEMKHDLCGAIGWRQDINMLKICHPSWRGHISITRPFGSLCSCAHKDFYAIGPDGKVFRCLSNMYTHDHTEVGCINPTGELNVNKGAVDVWKIKQETTECNNCVVYPSCFSMNCPAQTVYGYEKECPRDKEILMTIIKGLAEEPTLWKMLSDT